MFVCFFVKCHRGFDRAPSVSFWLFWLLVWLTTVGTASSLCQSFLLGPASQLIAGVAGTIPNLRNYDNEGVDGNCSLMAGVDGGGFHLMCRGGIFVVPVKCVICLVIIDK